MIHDVVIVGISGGAERRESESYGIEQAIWRGDNGCQGFSSTASMPLRAAHSQCEPTER